VNATYPPIDARPVQADRQSVLVGHASLIAISIPLVVVLSRSWSFESRGADAR